MNINYNVSLSEGLLFPIYSPYAKRHLDLFQTGRSWKHLILATLEIIPIFGALVSLVERTAAALFKKCCCQTESQESPSLATKQISPRKEKPTSIMQAAKPLMPEKEGIHQITQETCGNGKTLKPTPPLPTITPTIQQPDKIVSIKHCCQKHSHQAEPSVRGRPIATPVFEEPNLESDSTSLKPSESILSVLPTVQRVAAQAITTASEQVEKLPKQEGALKELQHFVKYVHSDSHVTQPQIIAHLSECRSTSCIETSERGRDIDARIIAQLEKLPRDQTIRYVSVASGTMLQDWVIIAKLIESGFKKFEIHLADLIYDEKLTESGRAATGYPEIGYDEVQQMKHEFETSLKILGAAEIETHLYSNAVRCAVEIKRKAIDILTCIDTCPDVIEQARSLFETRVLNYPSNRVQLEANVQEREHVIAVYAKSGRYKIEAHDASVLAASLVKKSPAKFQHQIQSGSYLSVY
jgi:hypothetical protein